MSVPDPIRLELESMEQPAVSPVQKGTLSNMGTETEEEILTLEETSVDVDTPWNVVVYDDPVNLMSFVTLVFRRVFGYSEARATELMLEVHQLGKSIVWTGGRERAEFYVQQLQGYQLLAALKRA